jgi:peptidoglycan/LPS O-acetylase OafA/YrhL
MKAAAPVQFAGLQSLRGIAAMIVLIHHSLFYFDTTPAFRFWSEALFNAHAAVMLFFVLSGFVLARSFSRRQFDLAAVATFYVRRAFRIVPAMWGAILLAALYFLSLPYLPSGPPTSAWYTATAQIAGTYPQDFVKALFGLPSRGVLPPLWSIRVEIVGSVLMPLFAALAAGGRSTACVVAAALGVGALLLPDWHGGIICHLAMFMIGATLVPFFESFRRMGDEENHGVAAAILAPGLLLLMFFRLANPLWRFDTGYGAVLPGLVEGCAAAVLIGLAGAQPRSLRALARPVFVYLGDISYSVYLLHFVFMQLIAKIMGLMMPAFISGCAEGAALLLASLTLLLTIPAGMFSYRFIERPGIEWGATLLGMLRQARTSAG